MKKTGNTLESILPQIRKDLGERSIVSLGDEADLTVPRLSTGVVALDAAMSGGLPLGRMVEIFGPEAAGKTSVAMMTAAQAQKLGNVVLIDAENAFDPTMAEKSGVDMSSLYIAQPGSLEETMDLLESLVKADDVSCIIVDSVAALVPRAELEGDYGDAHVALVARLLSAGLRKLNKQMQMSDSSAVLIWINQLREKMNVMGYGPSTTTPGGRALKHVCSTRIDVKRTGQVKQGDVIVGHSVKATVVKARSSPPGKIAEWEIHYETGVSNEGTVLDLAVRHGIVIKAGAWYSDAETGEKLGQGRMAVCERLREDADLLSELSAKVLT